MSLPPKGMKLPHALTSNYALLLTKASMNASRGPWEPTGLNAEAHTALAPRFPEDKYAGVLGQRLEDGQVRIVCVTGYAGKEADRQSGFDAEYFALLPPPIVASLLTTLALATEAAKRWTQHRSALTTLADAAHAQTEMIEALDVLTAHINGQGDTP